MDKNLLVITGSHGTIFADANTGEIFKRILVKLYQSGIPVDDIVLQVHDEGLIDGDYDLPIEEMEHIAGFYTPLEIKEKPTRRWQ